MLNIKKFFPFLVVAAIVIAGFDVAPASACWRTAADRRAIQWSDAIILADYIGEKKLPTDYFDLQVVSTIDGKLKAGDPFVARQFPAPGVESCPNHLSDDDRGHRFLVLLHQEKNGDWDIVYLSPESSADLNSLKDLIAGVRREDAAVTDERVQSLVDTLVNAQDDTEAGEADQALREIGPRGQNVIELALEKTTDLGKTRLKKVLADVLPPTSIAPTTQPASLP